jgi:hypothetical protein
MTDNAQTFPDSSTRSSGPRLGTLALVVLGAFALGAAVMFYLARTEGWGIAEEVSVRSDSAPLATEPLAASSRFGPLVSPVEPSAAEVRQTAQRVEQVEVQAGGIDQRVAAMEQRLTRLDLQSQAAAGNAARAEGMLIAFAARRSLERGQPLGFLEDQLRLRFGDARPNAVQTVIDSSQDGVTLNELLVQLDGMGSDLVEVPQDEGLMRRIGHELSQLFSIRTADTPSPVAERRLERARVHLESGQIERAIAEVRAMPNATLAQDWLDKAERYAAAQRALEVLETAAVLEPRDLRDGDGRRVEQPGLTN